MAEASSQLNQCSGERGVTLIEMLIVLALIGISAGIVTYALPSAAPARTVAQEAALLVARLNLAAERSLINGDHYKLIWEPGGYHFEAWQNDSWQPATDAPLSQAHAMQGGTIFTSETGGQRGVLTVTPDLLPARTGVVQLQLGGGIAKQMVVFDGAVARLEEGQP